jgi:protein O-mannosyl-transferase
MSEPGSVEPPPPSAVAVSVPTPDPPPWSAPPGVPPRSVMETLVAWAMSAKAFLFEAEPTFWNALVRMSVLSVILFSRLPTTNYIFDEQEALLANPYVNATGGLEFVDAIHRDFWGLPPDRSVGSYRPIPNFFWRSLWGISKQPFFHHFYNVLFHAVNGAIIICVVYALTKRRGLAWRAGAIFVACAVLTEAVSGIVGIADVLGGMGALAALAALLLPAWGMPFAVFAALLFGLFCKESALVCVPLVPFAALIAAPLSHPERPARVLRCVLALAASVAAFVLYVELRRRWFPSPLPAELSAELPEEATRLQRLVRDFLVWFHQAPLPKDPLNNPLAEADTAHRIGGALRVYWRGLVQVVLPRSLSGDYSYPQEPIPDELYSREIVAGAAMTALPPLVSVGLWVTAMVRERRDRRAVHGTKGPAMPALRWAGAVMLGLAAGLAAVEMWVMRPRGQSLAVRGVPAWPAAAMFALSGIGLLVEGGRPLPRPEAEDQPVRLGRAGLALAAIGLTWIVVSYFPHSNIPVVLPTVRAERFWYFPALGSCLVLAVLFDWLSERGKKVRLPWLASALFAPFLVFQCVQAYRHAMDYRDDVVFWEATKDAVPYSAKAHLNYSVMKGARGDLQTRLVESKIALDLAPKWPMAHVYTGDTLCRLHRAEEAWPYYKAGFDIGPNELSLIALALQCLHDEGKLLEHEDELRELAEEHKGSWIAYLGIDTIDNHEKHKGVDPKYRPRGYNEGPKEEAGE